MPPAESLYRDVEEGGFSLCLLALALTSKPIPPIALEHTFQGLQCVLKTNGDIQPHELNDY